MKKHLLIGIALSVGGTAFAQGTSSPNGITPQKVSAVAAKQTLPVPAGPVLGGGGANDSFESLVTAPKPAPHINKAPNYKTPSPPYLGSVIGTTMYQLQSNAAICNRLQKHADGTISATWTWSNVSTWADRGTGYNYFDGTSWVATTFPTPARVENTRVGFTNVAVTGTGQEFVVTHEAPTSGTGSGTHIAKRPAKGTGTWTDTVLVTPNPDTWPRMVIGGPATNSVHIISQTSGATTPVVKYHGQDGAISYSRSQNGGLTWDKIRTVIPAIDSSHYLGFGGDSYAIDIKGSTIAIVAGGETVDVILLKSTDNGSTWTKTIVHHFPIPMYTSATMVTDTLNPLTGTNIDTLETNDAAVAVLLDNSNNAHVWYGRMRVTCSTPGTSTGQGLSYFPYTDGLMYWNETMATGPVMIAAAKDWNGDGMVNTYVDPTGAVLGIGSFEKSLTSFPSAGIDASGKLFVTYSSVFEGLNDNGEGVSWSTGSPVLIPFTGPGKSFRHQYVMRSDDNGATWCTPIDLTDPDPALGAYDLTEGVYGAMARDVDANVHIIDQEDNSPGHGVASTGTPVDPQGTSPANIIYYKVPVANLACDAGVHENGGTVTDMNIYPNPTENTSVNLVLNSSKATKTTIKIYNVVGQEIYHYDNNLNTGVNTFNINISNYNAGVYFVSALVDGKNFTQKLIVK